ncbi:MAG: hypothetical protein H7039_18790, partial [Bryobacteraceae bacterium]|nr:hypothetical protein [Bryobacteraceae bacterium]
MTSKAAEFFSAYPGQFEISLRFGSPNFYITSLKLAAKFLDFIAPDLAASFASPANPLRVPGRPSTSAGSVISVPTRTLVRTGTGLIDLAAAGDIDLRNGEEPTYRTITGTSSDALG